MVIPSTIFIRFILWWCVLYVTIFLIKRVRRGANMNTFKDVSQRLLEKEIKEEGAIENTKLEGFQESCMRRHKGYFNEIAETLEITSDKLDYLKENGKWKFTKTGMDELVDLLFFYEKRNRGRKKSEVSKRLEKLMIKYGQYNAFSEVSTIELLEEYFAANKLIIMCIECFTALFKDAGVSEENIKEIMEESHRKFSYQKRKMYQESFEWIKFFLEYLETVNLERHGDIVLSENENTIWLEATNKKIKEDIDDAILIRSEMNHTKIEEMGESIWEQWKAGGYKISAVDEELETLVWQDCVSDSKLMEKVDKYKKIAKSDLDLKKMISFASFNVNEDKNKALRLVLKEIMETPVDGNVLRKRGDDSKLNEILEGLYSDITQKIEKRDSVKRLSEKLPEIVKNQELLKVAAEKVEAYRKLKDKNEVGH